MKAINQLAELQQRFFLKENETSYMLKELNPSNTNGESQLVEQENSGENLGKKRKLNNKDTKDDDDDDETGDDDNDDDEEIFSDTDEEMRANEMKRVKKLKKTESFNYSHLNETDMEDYLNTINKSFQKYR